MTPTLREIKKDYEEVVSIFNGIRDIKTLKNLGEKYHLTIEVNGESIYNWNKTDRFFDEKIYYVRVESYNCLHYIYFYYNNTKKSKFAESIYFDVWSDDIDDDFLNDININTLEIEYADSLMYVIERMRKHINVLEEKVNFIEKIEKIIEENKKGN